MTESNESLENVNFLASLKNYFLECPKKLDHMPKEGEVFGLYMNNYMLRAVRENDKYCRNSNINSCNVYLLDIGEIVKTTSSMEMYSLPSQCASYPAQAILCKLKMVNSMVLSDNDLKGYMKEMLYVKHKFVVLSRDESILNINLFGNSNPFIDTNPDIDASEQQISSPFRQYCCIEFEKKTNNDGVTDSLSNFVNVNNSFIDDNSHHTTATAITNTNPIQHNNLQYLKENIKIPNNQIHHHIRSTNSNYNNSTSAIGSSYAPPNKHCDQSYLKSFEQIQKVENHHSSSIISQNQNNHRVNLKDHYNNILSLSSIAADDDDNDEHDSNDYDSLQDIRYKNTDTLHQQQDQQCKINNDNRRQNNSLYKQYRRNFNEQLSSSSVVNGLHHQYHDNTTTSDHNKCLQSENLKMGNLSLDDGHIKNASNDEPIYDIKNKMIYPCVGEVVTLHPTHLINIGLFSGRYINHEARYKPTLGELIRKMNSPEEVATYRHLSRPLEKHELVLAKYKDGYWYRARVMDIDDEHVKIIYLDYGNGEIVEIEQIRRWESRFDYLPFQAILFKISGIKAKSQYSIKGLEYLKTTILEKSVKAKILRQINENLFEVKVRDMENRDIGDQLVMMEYAEKL